MFAHPYTRAHSHIQTHAHDVHGEHMRKDGGTNERMSELGGVVEEGVEGGGRVEIRLEALLIICKPIIWRTGKNHTNTRQTSPFSLNTTHTTHARAPGVVSLLSVHV